jgi:integrase
LNIVRLIWDAALAQGYVDRILPKPKLPRPFKKTPRYFRLTDVAKIIAAALRIDMANGAFYWLVAEAGLRAGELAGLRLSDVYLDHITVSQGVWNGKASTPKTQSAIRTVAVSGILAKLLYLQKVFQEEKGHDYLFPTSTGSSWDMNMFQERKMKPLLCLLGIQHAGLHAFRHFNASLLGSLRVPLKTIQERLGDASGGFLTLDVYTHAEKKRILRRRNE